MHARQAAAVVTASNRLVMLCNVSEPCSEYPQCGWLTRTIPEDEREMTR